MLYSLQEFFPYLTLHGRTFTDDTTDTLFFNWSGSGITFRFHGTYLRAKIMGIHGHIDNIEYPYIGICRNNSRQIDQRIRIEDGLQWYDLANDVKESSCKISIFKLTENFRGRCGLLELETDGYLEMHVQSEQQLRIEIIGDSITCGYGNEAAHRDDPFRAEEENAWETYGMIAARELDAEVSLVSVSGISVANPPQMQIPGLLGMEELYPYTDRPLEEAICLETLRQWDFSANPKDFIVINLGTNDVNAYKLSQNIAAARQFFQTHYLSFLKMLRHLNGPKTWILCTLGPLDYYLYDEICNVVSQYRAETDDNRISCFKFGGVVQWSEGYGAMGHPSLSTHRRMGKELAAHIKEILKVEVSHCE